MGAQIDLFSTTATDRGLPPAQGGLWGMNSAITLQARPESTCTVANPRATRVKALLCDVEDVLYDAAAWNRWLAQIFARLSQRSAEAEFNQLWHDEYLPLIYRGQQEFHIALAACLSAVGLTSGQIEEIVAASRAQRRQEENRWRPFPGVRATLGQLQAEGIIRCVIANSERSAQTLAADLSRAGLGGVFDHILTSADWHLCLRDVQLFEHALATVGCAPSEALFVGHCGCDLLTARSAGVAAVGFNTRVAVRGVSCLERFEELLDVARPQQSAPLARSA